MRLWLREETFWAATPLLLRERRLERLNVSKILALAAALRSIDDTSVRYTSWITHSWALLGWTESVSRLFWECASAIAEPLMEPHAAKLRSADETTFFALPYHVVAILLVLQICKPHPSASPASPKSPLSWQGYDSVWPNAATSPRSPRSPRIASPASPPAKSPLSPPRFTSTSSSSPAALSPGSLGHPGLSVSTQDVGVFADAALPDISSSPHMTRRILAHSARTVEDAARVAFVKEALPLLCRLVSSHENGVESVVPEKNLGLRVPLNGALFAVEDLNKLSVIVQGSTSAGAAPASLSELYAATAESPAKGMLQADAVVAWMKENLEPNDVLYPNPSPSRAPSPSHGASPRRGPSQPYPSPAAMEALTLGEDGVESPNGAVERKGRIAPLGKSQYSPVLLSSVHRETRIIRPSSGWVVDGDAEAANGLPKRALYVQDCSSAHVYALDAYTSCRIWSCSDITIVVGAVAGQILVSDCERVTVVTASRRVTCCNCLDSTFALYTPNPPVLAGDNRGIRIAPYNTNYSGLRRDLTKAGLAVQAPDGAPIVAPNMWNAVLDAEAGGEEIARRSSPGRSLEGSGSIAMSVDTDVKLGESHGKGDGEPTSPVLQLPSAQGGPIAAASTLYHLPPSEFRVLVLPESGQKADRQSSDDMESEGASNAGHPSGAVGVDAVTTLFQLPDEYRTALQDRAQCTAKVLRMLADERLSVRLVRGVDKIQGCDTAMTHLLSL